MMTTPEKTKKKNSWDIMSAHVAAFDHLTAHWDAASAYREPTSPKTPIKKPGGVSLHVLQSHSSNK